MDCCGSHGLNYIAMWDPHRNLLLGRYRLVKNLDKKLLRVRRYQKFHDFPKISETVIFVWEIL